MEELDASYARRTEEECIKCQFSLEDRLLAFRQDLEARYKQQLETELTLYRSRELSRLRQEERESYRQQMAKERADLNHVHQLKLEEARKAEHRMEEKYRRKEQVVHKLEMFTINHLSLSFKELEAGLYSQRQTLLSELNSLREKEAGLKREAELDKKALALEKEQLKVKSEQLEKTIKEAEDRAKKTAAEKAARYLVKASCLQ